MSREYAFCPHCNKQDDPENEDGTFAYQTECCIGDNGAFYAALGGECDNCGFEYEICIQQPREHVLNNSLDASTFTIRNMED